MTKQAATSVVVVSRGRPDLLVRCLTGIGQLYHTNFEVVVVADAAGRSRIKGLPLFQNLKVVPFEEANISAARNLGITASAGEIIAFIDDDAVPEPTWLCSLIRPFERDDIAATGGFVIGRNGISYQWKAGIVDSLGRRTPIEVSDLGWSVPPAPADHAVKTEGTNCAFRRSALSDLAGFDERFHYYLDETDLNMRCGVAGLKTAIVPDALVHHGFAANTIRTATRTPTDLHEIGASSAVYHGKHHGADQLDEARTIAREAQRVRLTKMMQDRRLTVDQMKGLLRSFDRGYDDGQIRKYHKNMCLTQVKAEFQRFANLMQTREMVILSGRIWSAQRLRKEARKRVQQGQRVSLFLFSPTPAFHKVRFEPDGFWEQRGGLFGKSNRDGAGLQAWTFGKRLRAEIARIAKQRGI